MLTDIAHRARVMALPDAVWRECAGRVLPAPLAPEADRCPAGQSPIRIQRRRTAGWTMPPGTVYVGRPTKFGNPRHAEPATPATRAAAVNHYRARLAAHPSLIAAARRELARRNLARWCPLDGPCRADVLLTVARGEAL